MAFTNSGELTKESTILNMDTKSFIQFLNSKNLKKAKNNAKNLSTEIGQQSTERNLRQSVSLFHTSRESMPNNTNSILDKKLSMKKEFEDQDVEQIKRGISNWDYAMNKKVEIP